MTSVAFFRNLNQGQQGSPTTSQLVDAFRARGALDVRPVRSNGTVCFDDADPESCLRVVVDLLGEVCGWSDVAFVRNGEWLAARAEELASHALPAQVELSLFDAELELTSALPLRGKGCAVVAAGAGYAITINDAPGTSQGTPTLERALTTPVTSRSATTIRLLLDHLGS
jgi:hypothetical protein